MTWIMLKLGTSNRAVRKTTTLLCTCQVCNSICTSQWSFGSDRLRSKIMEVTGGFDPYFTQKPFQGASERLFMAEKPGFEKKISENFWDFFQFWQGGPYENRWKKFQIFFSNPGFSAIIILPDGPWEGFLVKYGSKPPVTSMILGRSRSDPNDHWL